MYIYESLKSNISYYSVKYKSIAGQWVWAFFWYILPHATAVKCIVFCCAPKLTKNLYLSDNFSSFLQSILCMACGLNFFSMLWKLVRSSESYRFYSLNRSLLYMKASTISINIDIVAIKTFDDTFCPKMNLVSHLGAYL